MKTINNIKICKVCEKSCNKFHQKKNALKVQVNYVTNALKINIISRNIIN